MRPHARLVGNGRLGHLLETRCPWRWLCHLPSIRTTGREFLPPPPPWLADLEGAGVWVAWVLLPLGPPPFCAPELPAAGTPTAPTSSEQGLLLPAHPHKSGLSSLQLDALSCPPATPLLPPFQPLGLALSPACSPSACCPPGATPQVHPGRVLSGGAVRKGWGAERRPCRPGARMLPTGARGQCPVLCPCVRPQVWVRLTFPLWLTPGDLGHIPGPRWASWLYSLRKWSSCN